MPVHVHIGNLAAQSGASLFLHAHSPPYRPQLGIVPPISAALPWIYNKTENLTPADLAYDSLFTHAIAEDADLLPVGSLYAVEVIDGFRGWKIRNDVLRLVRENGLSIGLWRVFEMKKDIKLFIIEKYNYNSQ